MTLPTIAPAHQSQLEAYKAGLVQGSMIDVAATGGVVTYSFLNTHSEWTVDGSPVKSWTEAEKVAVADALRQWGAVTNLTFMPAADDDTAATLTFEWFADPIGEFIAVGGYPDMAFVGYPNLASAVALNAHYLRAENIAPGELGFMVVLHEIGHALGLKHTSDDGGLGKPTFADLGLTAYDSAEYTLMSYELPAVDGWTAATPSMLDIVAIQSLYGARPNGPGDDTYRIEDTATFRTIWDSGGTDTLDFSAQLGTARGLAIELGEGQISVALPPPNTPLSSSPVVGIAFGAQIENAIGTPYRDTLHGTDDGNRLDGGAAGDTLTGGAGDDVLTGGAGADRFVFAPGDGFDVITDFAPAAGDLIELRGYGLSSFEALSINISQVDDGVALDFGASNQIMLAGVAAADLDADDFAFG